MSLQIFYTPHSKETLGAVYNFINLKFGRRSADEFVLKAEKTIQLIVQHPLMFKASTIDENVRIGLISKQTSLFYRVTDTSIHLLFFWDNRQEPFGDQ
jgi:plasmid stabilization system protein ParE